MDPSFFQPLNAWWCFQLQVEVCVTFLLPPCIKGLKEYLLIYSIFKPVKILNYCFFIVICRTVCKFYRFYSIFTQNFRNLFVAKFLFHRTCSTNLFWLSLRSWNPQWVFKFLPKRMCLNFSYKKGVVGKIRSSVLKKEV